MAFGANSSSDAVLFALHLQPELDQAAARAESVPQRAATAAMSHGMDPLVQSHRYFPFAFRPGLFYPPNTLPHPSKM
jgi:hypothetical protein